MVYPKVISRGNYTFVAKNSYQENHLKDFLGIEPSDTDIDSWLPGLTDEELLNWRNYWINIFNSDGQITAKLLVNTKYNQYSSKVFERYYRDWNSESYHACYEVECLTLPWTGNEVGQNIAEQCKTELENEGLAVIRTLVSVENVFGGVYQRVKTDIWYTGGESLSLDIKKLAVPLIIIAAIILAIIGYFIVREIRQTIRPERITHMTCGICGMVFDNVSAYDDHRCVVHDICKYTCPYCLASFNTSEELERHIKDVHGEIVWMKYLLWIGVGFLGIAGTYVTLDFIRKRK